MPNPYLPDTLRRTAAAKELQIATLVANLTRTFSILTVDIEHEEQRAGVRDLADPGYPALARSLRVRKENIGATIASLEAAIRGIPKAA